MKTLAIIACCLICNTAFSAQEVDAPRSQDAKSKALIIAIADTGIGVDRWTSAKEEQVVSKVQYRTLNELHSSINGKVRQSLNLSIEQKLLKIID